jgi:hypothetical protein
MRTYFRALRKTDPAHQDRGRDRRHAHRSPLHPPSDPLSVGDKPFTDQQLVIGQIVFMLNHFTHDWHRPKCRLLLTSVCQ